MKKNPLPPADDAGLRRRAEERLSEQRKSQRSGAGDPGTAEDTARLVHKHAVHQIELEMQNESLRRIQRELETALERYTELCDSAPVGNLTLQPDGTIRQVNLTAASWLGIERSHLLNRRFSRFVTAGTRSTFEAILTRAFATRATEVGEVRLSIEGRPPLTVQLRAWVSGDGQECRVVLTDFTARQQAELELREAGLFNQQIVHSAREGVIVYGRDQRYQVWNPYMEHLTGVPASQVLGRPPLEVFPFLREAGVMERLERALAGEALPSLDFPYHIPQTGRSGWASDNCAALRNAQGEIIGAIATVRDITVRKRTEEELRALAARLQAVREEERTRVAREIHDVLAQELTRLKLDVVWLNRHLALPLDADKQKAVREKLTVMTAVTDMAIQSVQKIATELRPVVLDSLGLCAAVEWQARDFQARTGIACTATVPEQDVPLDRDRSTAMFRILQESLTNVLRHAQATRVDILLRPEAGQLVLRIQDNGCGIRPETLSNPMSIGLAGMRERALLLDGHLEIRSQPESGTTIEMRLPLSKNANPPEGKP
jgi:PAS domain S-box-containing protein